MPGMATIKHTVGRTTLAFALSCLAVTLPAAQIDTADFLKLQRGMSEAEVLIRAGEPDFISYPGTTYRETTIGSVDGNATVTPSTGGGSNVRLDDASFGRFRRASEFTIKQYNYIPDTGEHDPYLTVLTFVGGILDRIDRTKVFDRSKLPRPPADPNAPPPKTTMELERERIERTYDAAEQYANVRAKLKQQSAEEAERPPSGYDYRGTTIYRTTGDDGSVYFGDEPPDATWESQPDATR